MKRSNSQKSGRGKPVSSLSTIFLKIKLLNDIVLRQHRLIDKNYYELKLIILAKYIHSEQHQI